MNDNRVNPTFCMVLFGGPEDPNPPEHNVGPDKMKVMLVFGSGPSWLAGWANAYTTAMGWPCANSVCLDEDITARLAALPLYEQLEALPRLDPDLYGFIEANISTGAEQWWSDMITLYRGQISRLAHDKQGADNDAPA